MTPSRRTRALGAVAAASLLVGIAGCGGDDKVTAPPKQTVVTAPAPLVPGSTIWLKARRTIMGIQTVRVRGTISDDGNLTTYDMRIVGGKDCAGDISYGDGLEAQVRVKDGVAYLRGDDKFWRWALANEDVPDQLFAKVPDRWIVTPGMDDPFAELCPWDEFQRQLSSVRIRPGDEVDYNEQNPAGPALRFTDRSGDAGITVLASPPHRLVSLSANDGELYNRRDSVELRFSEYDRTAPIMVPPDAVTVEELAR